MRLRVRSRWGSASGFTLIELLVGVVVIAILAAVAVAVFGSSQDRAEDSVAQQGLMVAYKSAQSQYYGNDESYPSEEQLLTRLERGEPALSFQAYEEGAGVSTGPTNVSVSRDSADQISLCAKSSGGAVYCLRSSERGGLLLASTEEDDGLGEQMLAALAAPIAPLVPEPAHAASESNRRLSKCAGWNEPDTRACLATASAGALENSAARPGWNSPAEPTEEPEDPQDPDPTPQLSYAAEVAADGPSATCPFDESGSAYVNLQCSGVSGQLQDTAPRFITQQPGAILTDPASKSVGFDSSTHYSYGNPSGGSTNNSGAQWTAEVWGRSAVAAPASTVISADNNWAIRFAGGSGFSCDHQRGNPWGVTTITGGAAAQSGQWYHLVCVYNSGALTLYVNGSQVAQQNNVPVGQSGNGNLRPGYTSSGWTGGGYLNGNVDQFNFYKSALSPARIQAHYAASGR